MSGQVTAQMVKELRERTGVGMAKCKAALDEAGGDMDKAIDILRKSGMASAVKKEGRETKEGLIGTFETESAVALVEVNAETDFVTQNDKFKAFIQEIAREAAKMDSDSVEKFLRMGYSKDSTLTIDQYRSLIVQSIGENIQIRRLAIMPKNRDISIGIYSHMGGKIVVAVEMTGGSGNEDLARGIAMHVAAESPEYMRPEDVPAAVIAKEEEIAREQVKNKPAHIVDKIVEGKLKAFYDQVCLLHQKYVKDPNISIADLIAAEGKRLKKPLALRSFVRWQVGEYTQTISKVGF